MNFQWANEAELCLKSVGCVAGILENKIGKKTPIHEKESPRDLVTEMDLAIEKLLRTALSESPYPIVGEEMASDVISHPTGRCWYLDPIDGTANFVNNIPFYATSVGLMSGSEFVVGAVVLPALRELYFVSDCGEAYVNGSKILAKNGNLREALIGVSFSGKAVVADTRAREFELFGILNDKSRGCMRTGSAAINVCYVAAGKLQVAVGFNNKIWDVAGALAVACASGCRLFAHVDLDSNSISYVIGSKGAVEPVVAEMEMAMNMGFKTIGSGKCLP